MQQLRNKITGCGFGLVIHNPRHRLRSPQRHQLQVNYHLLLVTCLQWGLEMGVHYHIETALVLASGSDAIQWPQRPVDPVSPKCPTFILATWTQRQMIFFLWLWLIQKVTSRKTSTDQTIISIREKDWFMNKKHGVFSFLWTLKTFYKSFKNDNDLLLCNSV